MTTGASRRTTNSSRAEVQSVRRALNLLKAFSRERPELGVNELARLHGLHPSSVSRLLSTLADAGFVRMNPETGRYRPGFASLELAGLLLLQLDIRAVAQPIMRALATRTQETVNLAVLDGLEAVIVEQAPSPNTIQYVSWIGRRIPLHASSHGKVLLAFLTPARRGDMIAALGRDGGLLPRLTDATIRSVQDLELELVRIAARGYATAHRELAADLSGVAVPLFDHTGAVVASLAVPGPSYRYDSDRFAALAEQAIDAGRRISLQLGWRVPDEPGLPRPVANRALDANGANPLKHS